VHAVGGKGAEETGSWVGHEGYPLNSVMVRFEQRRL
jgi:hypothetical protein